MMVISLEITEYFAHNIIVEPRARMGRAIGGHRRRNLVNVSRSGMPGYSSA
jgi:hypothetical protein